MHDKAPVSVIIPAFKARNFIDQALESVFAQTHLPAEIIIVDDDSPEPIADLLSPFMANQHGVSVRLLQHEKNAGLGAARNTGITAATCQWVAFLDHDDLWAPDHLSNIINQLMADDGDLGFCSVIQFESDPRISLGLWGPLGDRIDSDLAFRLFERSFITPSATVIRRSILLDLGGFSTKAEVHMCEDLDLWLRLLQNGAVFSYSSKPTAFYRKHPMAATSRPGYMAYQAAHVRQMHMGQIKGYWLKKHVIVARAWWNALIVLNRTERFRIDILIHALRASLIVPWEIVRGLLHLAGGRLRRNTH